MAIRIISAGAGSGKTYRLTSEMVELLKTNVRATGIIATTFTNKAAAELRERVRVRLLEEGMRHEANDLTNALIGTVHSLGVKLLQRFSYEAGVSPAVDIMADEDQQLMFNQSLSVVMTPQKVQKMENLSDRLGLNKKGHYDWRKEVKKIADIARANDFSIEVLEKSKKLSFETFEQFLPQISPQSPEVLNDRLQQHLTTTISLLHNNADETKTTKDVIKTLKTLLNDLKYRGYLYWYEWAKLYKLKPGAKSRDDYAPLKEFSAEHTGQKQFREDIKAFIEQLFDLSIAAIREYAEYKKKRGLIDYTDMETLVKKLLDMPKVKSVLSGELDLLMVDEFQDTSPMQLEIFWKLSKFAKYSIWVGDPKQSIYGFRGADPKLMQALIKAQGGVKDNDIQEFSWRSREDIVNVTNAIFTTAFKDTPERQVILKPKRKKIADEESSNKTNEPGTMGDALRHWYFKFTGEGRQPAKTWLDNGIAVAVRETLQRGLQVIDKKSGKSRPAQPGDFAILCRSNKECQTMATSLHAAGLKAAVARSGLLETAEIKLILASLKYILNRYDSLSAAEILLLAAAKSIEDITKDRLDFLEEVSGEEYHAPWNMDNELLKSLDSLREKVIELSGAEILDLLIENLDLRRIIASWGKMTQRLGNIEQLRKLSLQYEEGCNRLHTAASIGGFLLWLNDVARAEKDNQVSGEERDAVNVLTYHRSKGLEYPIVICSSLENTLRSDVWGVSIIPEKEDIDLTNLLGNRWLRYWINPYADQYRNTALQEKIDESEAKKQAVNAAMQEEIRLMYVGMTRARDYLIFPTRKANTKWLNRVVHGREDFPALMPDGAEPTVLEWKEKTLTFQPQIFEFERDFEPVEVNEKDILFHQKAAGEDNTLHPFLIDPKTDIDHATLSPRVNNPVRYFTKPVTLSPDFLTVFPDFFAAYKTNPDLTVNRTTASVLISRFECENTVEVDDLTGVLEDFHAFFEKNFGKGKIYRQYPLDYHFRNQLFSTLIDWLLQTDNKLVVVKNSNQTKAKTKPKDYIPEFLLIEKALKKVFPAHQLHFFVHFPHETELVEVIL